MVITARNNPRVKELAELVKSAAARRERGLFVVEGPRMAAEVPDGQLAELWVSESFLEKTEKEAAAQGGSAPAGGPQSDAARGIETLVRTAQSRGILVTVSDDVFAKISDTKTPQGVAAVVRMAPYRPEDIFTGGPVLILENIQDPGNLGTMLRTAEGAGAGGVIMDSATADAYNPKVVRGTMGALFRVPHLVMDVPGAVAAAKAAGYEVFAAHLKGENDYTKTRYARAAFLIGNEGNGLTDAAAALADRYVRIPMEGRLESLNAAVAASLLLYEWHRQSAEN